MALTNLSERLRGELTPAGVSVTTVMLETLPSAGPSEPRIILPERSSYAAMMDSFSRWTGAPAKDTLQVLLQMVLEEEEPSQWMPQSVRVSTPRALRVVLVNQVHTPCTS